MKFQSLTTLPWARLLQVVGVSVLFSACTIEHMDVGVDQGGIGGDTTDGEPGGNDNECPDECPIPEICKLCEDNTCAAAEVQCKADGSCGAIEWVCASGPSPDPNDPPPGPSDPACPDVCDAVCSGEPEPSLPDNCPLPECVCEPDPNPACDCEVPAICHACDDGSCAEPNVECDRDGTCGAIDWTCPGGGSGSPGNPGQCPDPLALCEAQCKGQVLDVAPDCPVSDCDCEPSPSTCECAVPDICMLCPDETCAVPNVTCGPEGECGEILWTCEDPNDPPTCACAVDAVCRLCEDGSCAVAEAQCNPDGTCGETKFTCPSDPEKYNCDTSNVACDLAVNCEEGTVPTSNGDCYGPCVAPEQCITEPKHDCDVSQVVCKVAAPDCGPDLVPTHVDGCYGECVAPALCAPTDADRCPEMCPVIAICQLCEDGSCADPVVSCNEDGSCGDTSWVCRNE